MHFFSLVKNTTTTALALLCNSSSDHSIYANIFESGLSNPTNSTHVFTSRPDLGPASHHYNRQAGDSTISGTTSIETATTTATSATVKNHLSNSIPNPAEVIKEIDIFLARTGCLALFCFWLICFATILLCFNIDRSQSDNVVVAARNKRRIDRAFARRDFESFYHPDSIWDGVLDSRRNVEYASW